MAAPAKEIDYRVTNNRRPGFGPRSDVVHSQSSDGHEYRRYVDCEARGPGDGRLQNEYTVTQRQTIGKTSLGRLYTDPYQEFQQKAVPYTAQEKDGLQRAVEHIRSNPTRYDHGKHFVRSMGDAPHAAEAYTGPPSSEEEDDVLDPHAQERDPFRVLPRRVAHLFRDHTYTRHVMIELLPSRIATIVARPIERSERQWKLLCKRCGLHFLREEQEESAATMDTLMQKRGIYGFFKDDDVDDDDEDADVDDHPRGPEIVQEGMSALEKDFEKLDVSTINSFIEDRLRVCLQLQSAAAQHPGNAGQWILLDFNFFVG